MEEFKDLNMEYYTGEEIKDLIEKNAELYYADDGMNEVVIKFKDIPDFIVDYNMNYGMGDLRFFKVGGGCFEPNITTMGMFLDRIDQDLRPRIIDRLIKLQTFKIKPKKYKVMDADYYSMMKDMIKTEKVKNIKKIRNKDKEK